MFFSLFSTICEDRVIQPFIRFFNISHFIYSYHYFPKMEVVSEVHRCLLERLHFGIITLHLFVFLYSPEKVFFRWFSILLFQSCMFSLKYIHLIFQFERLGIVISDYLLHNHDFYYAHSHLLYLVSSVLCGSFSRWIRLCSVLCIHFPD